MISHNILSWCIQFSRRSSWVSLYSHSVNGLEYKAYIVSKEDQGTFCVLIDSERGSLRNRTVVYYFAVNCTSPMLSNFKANIFKSFILLTMGSIKFTCHNFNTQMEFDCSIYCGSSISMSMLCFSSPLPIKLFLICLGLRVERPSTILRVVTHGELSPTKLCFYKNHMMFRT